MENKKLKKKLTDLKNDAVANLESIEKDATKFGLDQLKNLKDGISEVEKLVKDASERKKVKTLTISADIHSEIKKYCVENEEKISEWVESSLVEAMKEKV